MNAPHPVVGIILGVVLLVIAIVEALTGHTGIALAALIAGLILGYGSAIRYRRMT